MTLYISCCIIVDQYCIIVVFPEFVNCDVIMLENILELRKCTLIINITG